MTTTLTTKLHAFVQQGISWEKFKAIQHSFEGIPNVRLSYCQGELNILPISEEHEEFSAIIGLLLGIYFEEFGIEFFPSGSYSQIVAEKVEFQSDLSYCLQTKKPIPDLCIEVVFSSGSINKLKKYEMREVPEVWFWEDGLFSLYRLQSTGYDRISQSEALPDLDLDLLTRSVLIHSKVQAMREFRSALRLYQ
ncbi:Uma2 family endonuclease [Myxacorys almedinensis]|uniref:Uma2 family endonuclease n=1 Tax=Myxacorys almedinensis A TaxID=2690445 RepID=A0A8J7Z5L8_9CYAN|nr:Uma2 family endonuclease [Myxacorys almedinensis]NDJ16858.1 Uma2 family endonuclease [Myxacorys almedinensis A]